MEYEMDEECSTHGEMRSSYKIVEGKPEGKRPILSHLERDRISILKLVAENRVYGYTLDSNSSGWDSVAGFYEDSNEL
jgi:hypothetical protein